MIDYIDYTGPALEEFEKAMTEGSTMTTLVTSVNTWCTHTNVALALKQTVKSMLETNAERDVTDHPMYSECAIVGKCMVEGKEVDLVPYLQQELGLELQQERDGETIGLSFLTHPDDEDFSLMISPKIEETIFDSLDVVVLLGLENLAEEETDTEERLQAQVNIFAEILDQMANGLFISISNCVTGASSAVSKNVDCYTEIDVLDLGLGMPQHSDEVTLRDSLNSVRLPVQNPFEQQFQQHTDQILQNATMSANRTEFKTLKEFGGYMVYDLRKGFPLMTSKFVDLHNVERELRFFNLGKTDERELSRMGCNIWKNWAGEDGQLGPVYGAMWRDWQDTRTVVEEDQDTINFLESQGYESLGKIHKTNIVVYERTIDQLMEGLEKLKKDPNDRRIVVTALNPGYTPVTKRAAYPEERLEAFIGEKISDTAGDYIDEYEAEGYGSSEEMAEAIVREEFGEFLNVSHRTLDQMGVPQFEVDMTPGENATVGQQALPPCHVLFQLGTKPMGTLERITEYAITRIDDSLFVDNPVTCSNFNSVVQREHNKIYRELGKDCPQLGENPEEAEQTIDRWLDEKNVPRYFLDLAFYQRSADMFVGIPYNAASYSIQLLKCASYLNMVPRNVHHYLGDKHIYENQLTQMHTLMENPVFPMPRVRVKGFDQHSDFDKFDYSNLELKYYKHSGKIVAGKLAV
tara:strand:- start:3992 stop:6061 length:2070 start_codon:yes stop_codon:yes gene_type:complete